MLNKIITRGVQKAVISGICYLEGILVMLVLHFKRGILMLSILTKVKGGMSHILTPIMKDGETPPTLYGPQTNPPGFNQTSR